uniref:Uncharacterized protein n=1 Tax=Callithrix jacchus TaxID=9483 RepID=A0A8I3WCS7_CALJA
KNVWRGPAGHSDVKFYPNTPPLPPKIKTRDVTEVFHKYNSIHTIQDFKRYRGEPPFSFTELTGPKNSLSDTSWEREDCLYQNWRLRWEDHLSPGGQGRSEPGGGGCGEPRSRHCTPAWISENGVAVCTVPPSGSWEESIDPKREKNYMCHCSIKRDGISIGEFILRKDETVLKRKPDNTAHSSHQTGFTMLVSFSQDNLRWS